MSINETTDKSKYHYFLEIDLQKDTPLHKKGDKMKKNIKQNVIRYYNISTFINIVPQIASYIQCYRFNGTANQTLQLSQVCILKVRIRLYSVFV